MLNNDKHILLKLLEGPWLTYNCSPNEEYNYCKYYDGQGIFLLFDPAEKKWYVEFLNMPEMEDFYYNYIRKHNIYNFEIIEQAQNYVDIFLRRMHQLLVFF